MPRQLWPEKRKRRRKDGGERVNFNFQFQDPFFPNIKRGSFYCVPSGGPLSHTWGNVEEKCSLFTYIENISLTQERPPIAARRAAQLQGGGEEDPGQHTGEAGGIWHYLKKALFETYFPKKNHLLDGKDKSTWIKAIYGKSTFLNCVAIK